MAQALAGDPAEVALEFKGLPITWGYLAGVAEAVDALLDSAGLGACAPIGFVPRNRPAFVGALLGLLIKQRSPLMVYAFQSPSAIAADLRGLRAPAVIADAQDWTEETLAALPAGVMAIALASSPDDPEPVRLLAGDPRADRSALRGATPEPVIELLTSGTTGSPKRAPTRYATVEAMVLAGSILDQSGTAGPKGDPGTCNFPISNISGIYSLLPMLAERRLVLFQEKFDLDLWLDFVRRHRPGTVVIPPAGIRMLLDRKLPADALAGVHYVQVGTSAIDPAAHRAFEEHFGIPILLTYGATEFCGAATTMTAAMHKEWGSAKFGSVGRPVGGNEVRIVDPADGRVLPANEVGIIEVKVPILGDRFIRTTDLGLFDDDGFLFHRGRADGVIMRGGFKIMPRTVEVAINAFPGVANSCVVGVPDPRLGEVPVAVVEAAPGAPRPDSAALEAHLRATLPSTNIPVAFIIADLPRTPSMKIDLAATRAFARERMVAAAQS